MNIIFFGNGDFSLKSLEYLHASKLHNIVLAVTNKVKKQGRGLKQTNTPIARYSINNNINLYKTNNININGSIMDGCMLLELPSFMLAG